MMINSNVVKVDWRGRQRATYPTLDVRTELETNREKQRRWKDGVI